MHVFLNLLVFFIMASAHGSLLSQSYENKPCYSQLVTTLAHWSPSYQWRRELSASFGETTLISPGQLVGEVIHVSHSAGGIEAIKATADFVFRVSWDQQCESKSSIEEVKHSKSSGQEFTDEGLKLLMSKNKTGLIFSYSTKMPLSLTALESVKNIALKFHLSLTVLQDPEEKLGQHQRLASRELILRGMSLHYPALVIYRDSKISQDAIVGLKSETNYIAYIQEQLK